MPLSKEYVGRLFAHLETGDAATFFASVSQNVDWTVMGTHPLAGHYTTLAAFRKATFERLTPCLDGPVRLQVQHVNVDGDTAIVELRALSMAKAGWAFDNRYCWVVDFEGEVIVRVRAYLDSAMVGRLIGEGEVRKRRDKFALVAQRIYHKKQSKQIPTRRNAPFQPDFFCLPFLKKLVDLLGLLIFSAVVASVLVCFVELLIIRWSMMSAFISVAFVILLYWFENVRGGFVNKIHKKDAVFIMFNVCVLVFWYFTSFRYYLKF